MECDTPTLSFLNVVIFGTAILYCSSPLTEYFFPLKNPKHLKLKNLLPNTRKCMTVG